MDVPCGCMHTMWKRGRAWPQASLVTWADSGNQPAAFRYAARLRGVAPVVSVIATNVLVVASVAWPPERNQGQRAAAQNHTAGSRRWTGRLLSPASGSG